MCSFTNPRNVTLNTFSTLIFSQLSHIKRARLAGNLDHCLSSFLCGSAFSFSLFISTTCSDVLSIKLHYAVECGIASRSVRTTVLFYKFGLYRISLAVMLAPLPPTKGQRSLACRGHRASSTAVYRSLYVWHSNYSAEQHLFSKGNTFPPPSSWVVVCELFPRWPFWSGGFRTDFFLAFFFLLFN